MVPMKVLGVQIAIVMFPVNGVIVGNLLHPPKAEALVKANGLGVGGNDVQIEGPTGGIGCDHLVNAAFDKGGGEALLAVGPDGPQGHDVAEPRVAGWRLVGHMEAQTFSIVVVLGEEQLAAGRIELAGRDWSGNNTGDDLVVFRKSVGGTR